MTHKSAPGAGAECYDGSVGVLVHFTQVYQTRGRHRRRQLWGRCFFFAGARIARVSAEMSAPDARVSVQSGTARESLLRILGDLVYPSGQQVPSRALITVLADVGYGEQAARQAIARCARLGIIAGERTGRYARWSLTPRGQRLLEDGNKRARQLGTEPPEWRGEWLAVFVSVPHERRALRLSLYRALRWSGCGMPEPGLWISAHPDRADQVRDIMQRNGLQSSTISFVGRAGNVGPTDLELVNRAWDMAAVAHDYRDALSRLDTSSTSVRGPVALRSLLQVDAILQDMVSRDPWLPETLCPHWPGRAHAAALVAFRDELLVPARAYWDELLPLS